MGGNHACPPSQRLGKKGALPLAHPPPCRAAGWLAAGGAWTIGYKAWGALLAKRLSQAGALVACLDYRNFPQAGPTCCSSAGSHGALWRRGRGARAAAAAQGRQACALIQLGHVFCTMIAVKATCQ